MGDCLRTANQLNQRMAFSIPAPGPLGNTLRPLNAARIHDRYKCVTLETATHPVPYTSTHQDGMVATEIDSGQSLFEWQDPLTNF